LEKALTDFATNTCAVRACGATEDLHLHHLNPHVLGGADDDSNLITLCRYHHGIAHGVEWRLGELIKAGKEKVRQRTAADWKAVADERAEQARRAAARARDIAWDERVAMKAAARSKAAPIIESAPPETAIRAVLIGSDRCEAEGFTVVHPYAVQAMCKRLLDAGRDPSRSLYAYRGDMLALKARSIGEAARYDWN
jgi:hypothetical protein